jgi:hypothetical protein
MVISPSNTLHYGHLTIKPVARVPYQQAGDFTFDKIMDKQISWQEIVQEVPIQIRNSALVSAVMGDLCAGVDEANAVVQAGAYTRPLLGSTRALFMG